MIFTLLLNSRAFLQRAFRKTAGILNYGKNPADQFCSDIFLYSLNHVIYSIWAFLANTDYFKLSAS